MSHFDRFLYMALKAAEFGEPAWRPMSTGEKVSIALALNRMDWLEEMRLEIPWAIELADSWAVHIPLVAHELRNRRQPHWRGFK